MVIRRLIIQIKQVVIQIAYAGLYLRPVKSNGLKCQVCHNCIDIMGKCLIYLQKNFLPKNHI